MLLRTEEAYKHCLMEIQGWREDLKRKKDLLKKKGLTDKEIESVLSSQQAFFEDMKQDAAEYERHKQGVIDPAMDMRGFGRALVGARIAAGLTQTELAKQLGVSEQEVARNEMNEYYGSTLADCARVFELLRVEIHCTFSVQPKTEETPKTGE